MTDINSVKHAQNALQELGLYSGTIDGIIGSMTIKGLLLAYNKTDNEHIHNLLQLSKNIHLTEVVKSQTATRYGIDNTPNGQIYENLKQSAVNLWQPVRDILGVPILISSGYRCPELNKRINGAKTSSHMSGFAIDFVAPSFGNTRKVVEFLSRELPKRNIKFDQIILEYPNSPNSWVHLGYKKYDGSQRNSKFQIG